MPNSFVKTPTAEKDYRVNWEAYLARRAETITDSAWAVTPAGLTVETEDHDDTSATLWISGGVDGVNYQAVNTITTSGGRTDQRTIDVLVRA